MGGRPRETGKKREKERDREERERLLIMGRNKDILFLRAFEIYDFPVNFAQKCHVNEWMSFTYSFKLGKKYVFHIFFS